MNQKRRWILVVASFICLLSVLTMSYSLKRVCIDTISQDYVNPIIANRIVDIVFDSTQDVSNKQLLNIQEQIEESSLTKINGDYFDQVIAYMIHDQAIALSQEDVQEFYQDVLEIVENNVGELTTNQRETILQTMEERIQLQTIYQTTTSSFIEQIKNRGMVIVYLFAIITSSKMQIIVTILSLCLAGYLILKKYFLSLSMIFLGSSSIIYFIIYLLQNHGTYIIHYLLNESLVLQVKVPQYFSFGYLCLATLFAICYYIRLDK